MPTRPLLLRLPQLHPPRPLPPPWHTPGRGSPDCLVAWCRMRPWRGDSRAGGSPREFAPCARQEDREGRGRERGKTPPLVGRWRWRSRRAWPWEASSRDSATMLMAMAAVVARVMHERRAKQIARTPALARDRVGGRGRLRGAGGIWLCARGSVRMRSPPVESGHRRPRGVGTTHTWARRGRFDSYSPYSPPRMFVCRPGGLPVS